MGQGSFSPWLLWVVTAALPPPCGLGSPSFGGFSSPPPSCTDLTFYPFLSHLRSASQLGESSLVLAKIFLSLPKYYLLAPLLGGWKRKQRRPEAPSVLQNRQLGEEPPRNTINQD